MQLKGLNSLGIGGISFRSLSKIAYTLIMHISTSNRRPSESPQTVDL